MNLFFWSVLAIWVGCLLTGGCGNQLGLQLGSIAVGDGNTSTVTQTQSFKQEFNEERAAGHKEATTEGLEKLVPPLPKGKDYKDTAQQLWEQVDSAAFLRANKPMRDARLDPTLKLIGFMAWTKSPQKFRFYEGVRTVEEQNAKYPKFSKCRGAKCPHVRRVAADFFICPKNNCRKAVWESSRCGYIVGYADRYVQWLVEKRLSKKVCLQREILEWDSCHKELKTGSYCK